MKPNCLNCGKQAFSREYDQNKRVYFFPEIQATPARLVLVVVAFWMDLFPHNDLVNIH